VVKWGLDVFVFTPFLLLTNSDMKRSALDIVNQDFRIAISIKPRLYYQSCPSNTLSKKAIHRERTDNTIS